MIDPIPTDSLTMDPEELRDAARRLLQDLVTRRAPYDGGLADDGQALFAQMVEQGWTLLTLGAEQGGLGQSFAALAPIYEELGKAVAPVFLAPTMAGLDALQLSTHAGAGRLMEAIAAGAARFAAAVVEAGALTLSGSGDDVRVSGLVPAVIVDPNTTHLMLLARAPARVLLVDLAGEGVSQDPAPMWDRSRRAADIRLEGARASCLVEGQEATDHVRAHLDLALALDSIGGARQSLEETIAYLGVRQQFGRPIGSFQALKHRAADHKVALEMAAALARHATVSFATPLGLGGLIAGQARLLANQAYRAISEDAVQLHGGIGFTWEQDCHLFLKRAWLNEVLFGVPEQRRDELAPKLLARVAADRPG